MNHTISRRLTATVVAVAAFMLLPTVQVAFASAAPLGTVLVAGPAWAGATGYMGDLNVYSDGPTFNGPYQCTELAIRWASIRYGEDPSWPIAGAYDMFREGPLMPVPFTQIRNGAGDRPQFGDLIVYDVVPAFPHGHVAVVTGIDAANVYVVEQNGSWTGRATLPISGTYMPPRSGSGQPVIGWLRAGASTYVPDPRVPGGQVLDSFGGVHPFGSALAENPNAFWPGWNIARDVATLPSDPNSGYVLDGWGGVHAFGSARPVRDTSYWPGWDIAKSLVLEPDGHSGYVLDGWGGLHPFGVDSADMPSAVTHFAYWPGWSIARSAALTSGQKSASGYVVDAFGGLHPFSAPGSSPPAESTGAYWSGWDIARSVVLATASSGYVLDGYGGVHAFGGAQSVNNAAYYPWSNARGIVLTGPGAGYVVFQPGIVRPFGGAPTVRVGNLSLPIGQALG